MKRVESLHLPPEYTNFKYKSEKSISGVLLQMRKEYKQEHGTRALVYGRNAGRVNRQPKTLVISGRHVGRRVMQKG